MSHHDENIQNDMYNDFQRVALFTLLLNQNSKTPSFIPELLQMWIERQKHMIEQQIAMDDINEATAELIRTEHQAQLDIMVETVNQIVEESKR